MAAAAGRTDGSRGRSQSGSPRGGGGGGGGDGGGANHSRSPWWGGYGSGNAALVIKLNSVIKVP